MGSLGPTGRLDALASTSERSELLEVLQVLADRDRITRDLHEHVIGRLFGIGLTLHGTQQLAKSPAVAARIAEHIEHLNRHRSAGNKSQEKAPTLPITPGRGSPGAGHHRGPGHGRSPLHCRNPEFAGQGLPG